MTRALPPVVGLDLSLTGTGIAVIRPDSTVRLGTVGEKGKDGATLTERRDRIVRQLSRILTFLEEDLWRGQDPVRALVLVEAPAFSRTTGQQHDRSGLWWHTVEALWPWHDVVQVSTGTRAKYATGSGAASKDKVLAAVVRRYPDVPVDGNDQADALALADLGRRHLGASLVGGLPLTHLAALDAVQWPTRTTN